MNLPNKLTVLRICMIPIFILVVGLPLDWGQFNVGDTTLAVTQLVGAVIFALASITEWLDGKIARARGLVTNFGKFADPLADKMLVMTGKVKTATQMVAIILLFINNIPFSLIGIPVDQIMLYACLIFTIYSGVDYFIKNSGVFKGSM